MRSRGVDGHAVLAPPSLKNRSRLMMAPLWRGRNTRKGVAESPGRPYAPDGAGESP